MNFLQLTNDFITESGACEKVGSVVNQEDEQAQAVLWVRDAWIEIQRNRLWRFRWAEGSFTTVVGKGNYTLTELVRSADDDLDMASFTMSGEPRPLVLADIELLRYRLRVDPTVTGTPKLIAQRPDDTITIFPPPDSVTTIDYQYYKAPVELLTDTDSPTLNPKFHKVITWKALEQYAREQGKEWNGLYQAAVRNFNSVYGKALEQETGRVHIAPSPF